MLQKAILKMKESLDDESFVSFVSANGDYHFAVRKDDDVEFLDNKTILIQRKTGKSTIVNLDLIIGICIQQEWI